jgi:hypothetical protein
LAAVERLRAAAAWLRLRVAAAFLAVVERLVAVAVRLVVLPSVLVNAADGWPVAE